MIEKIENIIESNFKEFKGSNEAVLHASEDIAELLEAKDKEIVELKSSLFHSEKFRQEDAFSALNEQNVLRQEIAELKNTLIKVDESLTLLEDETHGKIGEEITKIRKFMISFKVGSLMPNSVNNRFKR